MSAKRQNVATRLIHAGEIRPRIEGAIAMPIFQSSTFEDPKGEFSYHDIRYMRLTNLPNHVVLHEKLRDLEGAEAAIVAASGMAAISAAMLSVLKAGDHVLLQDCLYGGTHNLVTDDLPGIGVEFDFVSGGDRAAWEAALKPNTRAIYVETMTNPLLQVADFPMITGFARDHGLVSMVDNTAATPLFYRPCEQGFDLALQSATKYLNGHSDIVAGVIAGRADLVTAAHHKLNHLGGSLDSNSCYLLKRGLATLGVRLPAQSATTLALAQAMQSHPRVEVVHYPGLPEHPDHARARKLFSGFGGLMSFELAGGVEAVEAMLSKLQLPARAPSFGGVETLVTVPARTSHAGMSPADRQRAGVPDHLVRVSVGLEAAEDLIADFQQALAPGD